MRNLDCFIFYLFTYLFFNYRMKLWTIWLWALRLTHINHITGFSSNFCFAYFITEVSSEWGWGVRQWMSIIILISHPDRRSHESSQSELARDWSQVQSQSQNLGLLGRRQVTLIPTDGTAYKVTLRIHQALVQQKTNEQKTRKGARNPSRLTPGTRYPNW